MLPIHPNDTSRVNSCSRQVVSEMGEKTCRRLITVF